MSIDLEGMLKRLRVLAPVSVCCRLVHEVARVVLSPESCASAQSPGIRGWTRSTCFTVNFDSNGKASTVTSASRKNAPLQQPEGVELFTTTMDDCGRMLDFDGIAKSGSAQVRVGVSGTAWPLTP